jgi:hypothetical protein
MIMVNMGPALAHFDRDHGLDRDHGRWWPGGGGRLWSFSAAEWAGPAIAPGIQAVTCDDVNRCQQ